MMQNLTDIVQLGFGFGKLTKSRCFPLDISLLIKDQQGKSIEIIGNINL